MHGGGYEQGTDRRQRDDRHSERKRRSGSRRADAPLMVHPRANIRCNRAIEVFGALTPFFAEMEREEGEDLIGEGEGGVIDGSERTFDFYP